MDATALQAIAAACGGVLLCGDGAAVVTNISKDTRTLRGGDLYWALQGESFDGHNFVAAAAESGAAGAVVSRVPEDIPAGFALVKVDDTLAALQRLAAWYRDRLTARVVCLTGSNGKTSTKDFAAAVTATKFAVNKTEGNLNNHIGLPLTILSARKSDEVCVWEIGMNHAGEIEPLARLARPDIGIITNIGVAHIEFLGSREAIAQEKGMLGEVLTEGAVMVLPEWDEFTPSLAARTKARVVMAGETAGLHAENLRPSTHGLDFDLVRGKERVAAHLPVTGEHMVRNALLAVSAGLELGLSLRECASGLALTKLSARRLACLDVRGITVLDDSYNANPDSMEAALHALRSLPGGGRRFAVLGRMGELGAYADEGYRRVGRAAAASMDVLIAVGPETDSMAEEAERSGAREVRRADDTSSAARLLRELARPGDAVVIKGSRAARMERVLEDFA
jgi:UDP-N-acetylmuramoyl-tripeptide--D-alanyl-D-alanine ligase